MNHFTREVIFQKMIIVSALTFLVIVMSVPTSGNFRKRDQPYVVNRWFDQKEALETPFENCGGSADLKSVEVIPCDSDDRCTLHRGSNATVKLNFVPANSSQKLTAVVHGVLAGIPLPFHLPQEDACTNSKITCPINQDKEYNYVMELPILKTYPSVSVTVKWELKDDQGEDVVCVKIPARLA